MKLTRWFLIFLLVCLAPMGAIYLLSSGFLGTAISLAWLVALILVATYADKVILYSLKAREVTPSDHETFYQIMKRQSYHKLEKTPKLYLYSGTVRKCFLLESRGETTFVLDRKMIDDLETEESEELVKWLLLAKQSKEAWLQTKGMALNSLLIIFIYKLSDLLSFGRDATYKLISFVLLTLTKPFMEFIEWMTKSKERVEASESLKTLFYRAGHGVALNNLSEYIGVHLEEGLGDKEFLVEYLETFPTIENCEFILD